MADGTNSAEDSSDNDSNLSRTRAATGHKKRPDDDSDLGRSVQLPDTGSAAHARLPHRGKKDW